MNGKYIGLVKKYLTGELKQREKEQFEQELIGNLDLQDTLRSYKILYYSENRLSKSEKEIFEKELNTNPILNEKVRLQKVASEAVQGQAGLETNFNGWESYKDLIKNYPVQNTSNNTEVKTGKVVKINKNHSSKNEINPLRKWMKIAAAVFLGFLTIASIWGINKISVSNEEIAISGVEDTKLMRKARSFSDTVTEDLKGLTTKLSIAQALLDKYQFSEAIPILEEAKKQAEIESSEKLLEIHWALATAYTGVSDTPKAIPEYEAIVSFDERKKDLQEKAKYNLFILKIKDKLGLEE